jgi:hypothetical protein
MVNWLLYSQVYILSSLFFVALGVSCTICCATEFIDNSHVDFGEFSFFSYWNVEMYVVNTKSSTDMKMVYAVDLSLFSISWGFSPFLCSWCNFHFHFSQFLQYVAPVICAQGAFSWVYVCTVDHVFFVRVCVNLLLVWVVIFWIFWLWPLLLWMPGPQRHIKMCYVVLHSYFKFIGSYVSDI